jgi:DNA-binding GntR family transcriptional regulator
VSVLTALSRTFLWEEAASAIRRAIIAGELRAGEHVSEASLAQRLGISRAPVRDAMRMLVQEGLLAQRNGATTVEGWSDEDVRQLYELRLHLESFAFHMAVERLDTQTATGLRTHVAAMRRAAGAGQMAELAAADLAFHRAICQAAHHRWLLVAWDTLAPTIEAALSLTDLARSDRAPSVVAGHARLVDLLEQHDADAAEVELRAVFEEAAGILSSRVAAQVEPTAERGW